MAESKRGRVLTTIAILFVVLAVTDVMKPFRLEGSDTGFVFLGTRLAGVADAIVGPLFGLYLIAYALAIWRMRRYALPMAYAYAAYVILNLILFTARNPQPPGVGNLVFGIVYSVVAIGVSSGTAIILRRRKADLA